MTDNRTTELLPCPFCGGEPEIRERKVHHTDWFGKDYRLMYRVRCTKCGAAIGGYSPVLFHRDSNGIEHGAGVDWNTRTPEQAIAATLGSGEPSYDELIRCLENDWHISASWDGLRKFWCVELTEEGVRMRDAHDEALRCSDCKYYGNSGYDDGYCYYWNTCDFGNCIHDPDDFCSRGEPKTVCQIPDSDLVLRPFCRSVRGHCSECGVIMCDASNYCQNCGRKVMG